MDEFSANSFSKADLVRFRKPHPKVVKNVGGARLHATWMVFSLTSVTYPGTKEETFAVIVRVDEFGGLMTEEEAMQVNTDTLEHKGED
jgi:hypothetical protein